MKNIFRPLVGSLLVVPALFTLGLSACGTDVELSASQTQTSQALDSSTSVWINEFHYDNAGGDVAEGVEIAGEAGTDLSGYSIVLYNGSSSSGASYKTEDLVAIPDEGAGQARSGSQFPVSRMAVPMASPSLVQVDFFSFYPTKAPLRGLVE